MGGMGPEATVDFMAKVIAMSGAERDQDHVHMIVDNDPTVPNRQVAIRTGNDDVTPHLADMAERLEQAGADFLVMVCNTAHVFMDDALNNVSIPFISIIDESVAEVERQASNAEVVGVMATDGCLNTDIYQDAIEAAGKTAIIPDTDGVVELMRLITAIKAGDKSAAIASGMAAVAQALADRGAGAIIAGCTEIPLVFDGAGFPVPVISSTDVLAERTVSLAMGREPLPPALD
jgi:aspartate racemase